MQAGRQASKSGVHGVEWSGVEKWSGVDRVEQAHHAGRQAGRQASRQTHTSTGTSGKPNDVVASRFRLAEFRGVQGIVSTGVFGGQPYCDRITREARKYDRGSRMGVKQVVLQKHFASLQKTPFRFESAWPFLEAVWWQRIIHDEFHESTSWKYCVRECVKGMRSDFKWGLSGTPPLGSTDDVIAVISVGSTTMKRTRAAH